MKKFAFVVFVLMCLVSCKTDLTDIENHIKDVETQGQTLDNKVKQLKDESQRLSNAVKDLQNKSEELQKKSEELQKKSEELGEKSEELEKANQVLKDSLESLRNTSLELAAELLALQEEGMALSDSLDVLRTSNDLLVEEWDYLNVLISQAQETIEELTAKIYQTDPKLIHMEFLASENPLQLVEDAECIIVGDSAIECRVLNVMSSKTLIPRFRFTGDFVTIDGQEAVSSKTAFDFSYVRVIVVHAGEQAKKYTITVSAYTGLPTLWAETTARTLNESNHYYKATIRLDDNVRTGGNGGLAETTGRIMAQGPLRWYEKTIDWSGEIEWGKNDYQLSFSTAVPLLNMPAHNDWKLMPNVGDITMLHNQTAFFMGKMSNLDYTPRFQYVDLMFNGRYSGTYMLGESLEAATSRVNVGNNGFIISVGSTTASPAFSASFLEKPVSILSPSSPTTSDVNVIAAYVREAESVLFSSYFADEHNGWQQYLDINSFVDWFLINEIAKNSKGAFWSNCIMNMKRGGKLKMGPLWDFENAFGDAGKTSSSGFVIMYTNWYYRLFQDPVFVAKVKERFDYFYNHQTDILKEINENAQYLKYAVKENDTKWDTFEAYKKSNSDIWVLYQGHVSSMKSWLTERMNWLKEQFDAM